MIINEFVFCLYGTLNFDSSGGRIELPFSPGGPGTPLKPDLPFKPYSPSRPLEPRLGESLPGSPFNNKM